MRSRQASATSRAVVFPVAIASAASVSEARDQSVMFRRQRQEGGAVIGRIDIEVDLGVHPLDSAAELLELDRQLLDARRLELQPRIGVVHDANELTLDHGGPFTSTPAAERLSCQSPALRPKATIAAERWSAGERGVYPASSSERSMLGVEAVQAETPDLKLRARAARVIPG